MEEGELVTEKEVEIEMVKVRDLELTVRDVLKHAVVFEYPCFNVRS